MTTLSKGAQKRVIPTPKHEFKGKYTYAVGKRKTAVARLKLYSGAGNFFINGIAAKQFLSLGYEDFVSPFTVASATQKKYDIDIRVTGGGIQAKAEAARHALSKALEMEDESRRLELKKAGLLTRDSRIKERKKPGLRRARRSPQWSKR